MNFGKLITRAEIPNFSNLFRRFTTPSGQSIFLFKNVPTHIYTNAASVGTVGAGNDTLHTVDLPSTSLPTNLDYFKAVLLGTFANTANNKRLEIVLDGNTILNTGAFAIQNRVWSVILEGTRISATSIRTVTRLLSGDLFRNSAGTMSGNGIALATIIGDFTVSDLGTTPLTITVIGEGTANDDVAQHLTKIELCQQ